MWKNTKLNARFYKSDDDDDGGGDKKAWCDGDGDDDFLCNVDGVVVPEAAVSWSGPISPTLLANFSGGRSRIESVY